MMPPILTIAGSDCSGGAGIQADLKTIQALGGYGMSAITALTAQNTLGVQGVHPVPAAFVAQQIQSVLDDIPPAAIKTGMLANTAIIDAVADILRHAHKSRSEPTDAPALSTESRESQQTFTEAIYIVLDPVMIAKGGASLLEEDAVDALKNDLIPLATLLTPNIPEAEKLSGVPITNVTDMEKAAGQLLTLGAQAVLIKGGHLNSSNEVHNLLLTQDSAKEIFTSPRIDTNHTHGTGCTLSAAIATYLGQGQSLHDACANAENYVAGAIKNPPNIGHGHGPLNHSWNIIQK